mgnify:CR=1 FL=1
MAEETEKWRFKRLIRRLSQYRGLGTSVITLCIKAGSQIALERQRLADEFGSAVNVKSRANRQSILTAITSAQQALKNYNHTPPNGLALYCGEVTDSQGKTKKIVEAFEPPFPLKNRQYFCGNRFDLEPLSQLLEDQTSYGYLVVDGSGLLIALVKGNQKQILAKFQVDLPKKHRKGGQSSARFGRLRDEAIGHFITKCAEQANISLLSQDQTVVSTLIVAGLGDKKTMLLNSARLDPRIKALVTYPPIEVAYGGEAGLDQAIQASGALLSDLKLHQEREVLQQLMDQINRDQSYCLGLVQTKAAIDMGAVDTLIVYSDLEALTSSWGLSVAKTEASHSAEGAELDEQPSMLLVDWLLDHYKTLGINRLYLVSDASSLGTQFKAMGGVGAILRWHVDSATLDADQMAAEAAEAAEDDFI